MEDTKNCRICTEVFNNNTRKIIICPYCSIEICMVCIRTYLVEYSPNLFPSCSSCKKEWSLDFVSTNTPNVFHNNIYRLHRAKIVVDREKSILHSKQNLVIRELQIRECIKRNEQIAIDIKKLKTDLYMLRKERIKMDTLIRNPDINSQEEQTRNDFIQMCVVENCRGYLSSQWKCCICKTFICSHCHIVKNSRDDENHVCDKDTVDTIKLIIKESKSCPQCGIRTCKIDGCDQMWCISCKTPWSWVSGKKETGTIHNPHYYEWLRSQNGGNIPRNPRDLICGGIPSIHDLIRHFSIVYACSINESRIIMNPIIYHAIRIITHITQVELPIFPNVRHNMDTNNDLSVKYLLREITEDQWIKEIKKREKQRERRSEINQILTTFITALTDYLITINKQYNIDDINISIDQIVLLRDYINRQLEFLSKRFSCVNYKISEDKWTFITV